MSQDYHYYVANSLCYAKGATPGKANRLLTVTHFPDSPDNEMPITVIKVMTPITVAYAIESFLPSNVQMIVEQQDYESNLKLNTLCLLEDGIIYSG